jgi:sucrose-6-phosphate hydrolase SacC (GH32 family)
MYLLYAGFVSVCVSASAHTVHSADILIADFEEEDYGQWRATGEAFGPGPARGTLPDQMAVSGYEGRSLVNSFYGGDRSMGTLTSPEFGIERNYINFLVGGGQYPGKTCVNLIVDGRVVRTATGPNDEPGGSEVLDWYYWDVREFRGQPARVQIVDERTGGWGHINVDHIYQSDEKVTVELERTRQIAVDRPYLLIPVDPDYAAKTLGITADGLEFSRTSINLTPEEPRHWVGMDIAHLQGKVITLRIERPGRSSKGMERITLATQLSDDVEVVLNKTRSLTIRQRYLNFPVKNGAPQRLVHFLIDGKLRREFTMEIADAEPDFWVYLDVSEFKGQTAQLRVDQAPRAEGGFDRVFQDDVFPGEDRLYQEQLRPQFHFTSKRGWNNDTNGMMYHDGEYHLFWQHNPYGWNWGNMTWGHAVSPDLVHWTELGDAVHPDEMGTIFSGSGVVDERNSAGFQTGKENVLVCVYTSAGGTNPWSQGQPFTQSISYSNDRGRTWTKYANNPVVDHIKGGNRDPKAIWYEPGGHWVMVLYLDSQDMGFFTSSDLKQWQLQSKLKCFHECPELFELPVDGDASNTRWVLYGGSGDYLLGSFDGKTFQPDGGPIKYQYGNCFYASQTFNNIPPSDGRRIQMAWGQVAMPGMPFNQMILFPVNLTLRTTDIGLRMHAEPVREIAKLHRNRRTWQNRVLRSERNLEVDTDAELLHIKADLDVRDCQSCGVTLRGIPIVYNAVTQELTCQGKAASLKPIGGRIYLELIVDRTSIEIFANHGRVYMPIGVHLVDRARLLEVFATGGHAQIESLTVYDLESIWP